MIAPLETVDTRRRKRLGQFFTGEPLARLLAALSRAHEAQRIIDPMAGSGDMLAACSIVGSPRSLVGIEIDPTVAAMCRSRFDAAGTLITLLQGNAFDPAIWDRIGHSWDLVITNPPYVRYQLASSPAGQFNVPGSGEIRNALVACLSTAGNLGENERSGFIACAKQFSGLADLAVPSWILCSARVCVGGRLAIVVPNTWLSRDYAAPVLYVLRRFFEIEYVVEDADAAWFPDALARTTLVVARRVEDKGSPYGPGGHLRVNLPSDVANGVGLVGTLFPEPGDSERSFAEWAAGLLGRRDSGVWQGVRYTWSDEHDLVNTLRHAAARHEWLPSAPSVAELSYAVPEQIRLLVGDEPTRLASLEALGWTVGQGLRTGGNDFFYVSADRSANAYRSPLLPTERLALPLEVLRPAVRRQAELPADGQRVVDTPQSYVLLLEGWALPDDIRSAEGPRPWQRIEGDLARLVRTAATTTYRRGNRATALPELSAVRTNVRAGADEPRRAARFWYQLPPLSDRHIPNIYLARVNGGAPTPFLNLERSLVVDANFSTLWPTTSNALPAPALLALLSSSWTNAFLEATGTVLGGGALKIEATHLRRLLLPVPDAAALEKLMTLAGTWLDPGLPPRQSPTVDEIVYPLMGLSTKTVSVSAFALDRLRRRTK